MSFVTKKRKREDDTSNRYVKRRKLDVNMSEIEIKRMCNVVKELCERVIQIEEALQNLQDKTHVINERLEEQCEAVEVCSFRDDVCSYIS